MSDAADDRKEPGSLDNEGRMKVLYTSAGYIAGIHTELDAVRNGFDPQDPIDHNIEQAQIALEEVTMRLGQVIHYVSDLIKAERPEAEPEEASEYDHEAQVAAVLDVLDNVKEGEDAEAIFARIRAAAGGPQ